MTEAAGLSIHLDQDRPIPLSIDLSAVPGEILAIVGPSGSGKSTTLRVVAGLHRPSAGHIVCNGTTWLDTKAGIDVPARRRRVGLVFQSYALFPHLTALENVVEALQDRPPQGRRQRSRGRQSSPAGSLRTRTASSSSSATGITGNGRQRWTSPATTRAR